MAFRTKRPLPRSRPMRLCVALTALVATLGIAPAGADAASASPRCDVRVNNTPSKLVDCVTKDDLWRHMKAFQAIADANPGPDGMPSRNSGEPGYKASVDYVANVMRKAGYDVTVQPYKFFTTPTPPDRTSRRSRRPRGTTR